MRVLIVSVPGEHTPHRECVSESQLLQVRRALLPQGFLVECCTYSPDTIANDIRAYNPSLIFNLTYGYCSPDRTITEFQHETTRRIEMIFPHLVGSSHRVQAVTQDKRATGEALFGTVHVPAELSGVELSRCGLGVAKPRFGACHRGVEIVRSPDDVDRIRGTSAAEFIVQEYIDGVEYTVGVIERGAALLVFSPIEIRFEGTQGSIPRIMDWDKWRWQFVQSMNAPACLTKASQKVFRRLGMRDYARFDFRVREGVPYLLDANSLPNLDPKTSLLPYMSQMDGVPYGDLVLQIVSNAASRALSEVIR